MTSRRHAVPTDEYSYQLSQIYAHYIAWDMQNGSCFDLQAPYAIKNQMQEDIRETKYRNKALKQQSNKPLSI